MTSRRNIKRTLKQKLFLSPSPMKKAQYLALKKQLFPSEKDFIAFLDETSDQETVVIARRIVARLAYEMTAFMPPSLAENVLDMETRTGAQTDKGHAARDHFVHLVHLYLLGIYLFFYFPSIHVKLLGYFDNVKRKARRDGEAGTSTTIEDFVSTWKLFVLSHDLAYPFEAYSLDPGKRQFLKPAQNLCKLTTKMLLLKALSRLVALRKLFTDVTEQRLSAEIEDARGAMARQDAPGSAPVLVEDEAFDTLLETWGAYRALPKVTGAHTVKSVLAFTDRSDLVAVLVRKQTGKPAAFVVADEGRKTVFFLGLPSAKSQLLSADLHELAFSQGVSPSTGYAWSYFARSPLRKYNAYIKALFPDTTLRAQFIRLAKSLQNESPLQLRSVTTDEHFKAYGFYLHTKLSKFVDEVDQLEKRSHLDTYYLARDKALSEYRAEFTERVCSVVTRSIKEQTPFDDIKPLYETGEIADAVNGLIKPVFTNYRQLQEEVADSVIRELTSQIEFRRCIYSLWNDLRSRFGSLCSAANLLDSPDDLSAQGFLDALPEAVRLDQRLKASHYPGLSHLFEHKPSFATGQRYYDHGVIGSMMFLSAMAFFKGVCPAQPPATTAPARECERRLLKLACGIGLPFDQTNFTYLLDHLVDEAALAVCMHNIVPADLKSRHRTTLGGQPFAFLCILADEIQEWDRKRAVNLAHYDLPYEVYSNNYNLSVKGDFLAVFETGARMDIAKRNQLYRDLDRKLRNASDLFVKHLAETPPG